MDDLHLQDPKRGSYRLAASTFFFASGIVFASWASRIPDVKQAIGLDDAGLGTVLLGLPLGQISAMALSGWLVARFSSKIVSHVASVLYPGMLLVVPFASTGVELFLTLLLFGVFANLNNISINTQAVSVERFYPRTIMGTFHGVWSLAGFAGGGFAFFFAPYLTVMQHFLLVNAYTLLNLAVFGPRLCRTDSKPEADPADAGKTRGMFSPTPYIITLGVIAFGCMSCEGIMYNWSIIYYQSVIDAPENLMRLGYVCCMGAMAAGRFMSDFFAARFGVINLLRASGLMMFSGLMITVLFPHIIISAIGFLGVGFGVSGVIPMCYSAAGHSRRMSPSIAIATVSTIGFLGFLMGPPLIGYVAYATSLRVSFTLIALLGILVFVLSKSLKSRIN